VRSARSRAEGVRQGVESAASLVEEAVSAVSRRETEVHAFNHLDFDLARKQAERIDRAVASGQDPGPLAGQVVAIKDNICVQNMPTTCSSRILAGWRPPYDATVIKRIQDSGAVILGKTNMDEFAMGSSTEHSAFGPTRNPHAPDRVPGGSSGGSAAAVAAEMVPLALGSDTGGSIRQPAALCGVVGVKPTYGLVSRYGLVAFASSLDQIGPFAACVEDAALLLEVIAGDDPLDSTCYSGQSPEFVTHLDDGVDGLRVGLLGELIEGSDPGVAARVNDAAELMASSGAKVETASLPVARYGLSAYYLLATAEASSNLARFDGVRYGYRAEGDDVDEMYFETRTRGFGAEVKRRIMLGTYALSAGYYDAYYGRAQKVRRLIQDGFRELYAHFDLLLAPTTPTVAFPIGAKLEDPLQMYLSDVCTIPSNLAGDPALSVPFGTGEDGLPVGVQLLGPALGDARLLSAAVVLEAGAP
jgi:aspartyl-tRNA(Asn)/glutamyl-tRNA(Gln) amidotransferase subunit A